MNSRKNSIIDTNEDLKFIPLNISEPFKSKDSSWAPFINMDVETDNMTNNFFIGLPNLETNNGFKPLTSINTNPQLPYPENTTMFSMSDLNNEPGSMNLNNNLNMIPGNMNFNNNNLNTSPENTNNIATENELFPSETSEDELYSYNTNRSNNSFINNLPHLDILRDFDLSIDSDIIDDTRSSYNDDIDKIFSDIEENDSGLLGTLKAYNVPYPIANLILKKTIKLAITNYRNK